MQEDSQWRSFFEALAINEEEEYSASGWTKSGFSGYTHAFPKQLRKTGLKLDQSLRALDAGCGVGTYSRILTRLTLDVYSVDYSEVVIKSAQRRSVGFP